MKEVFLHSLSGNLQGCYTECDSSLVALILPPHPMHNGTMNNKVVVALYEAFVKNNFSTLKINFRGVQKSAGTISKKDEDLIKDSSTAINWLETKHPFLTYIWVAGFSFGSWLAMNLVMRRPEISGFISVCPPTKSHDFSFVLPCTVPGMIINAAHDILAKEKDTNHLNKILSERVDYFESCVVPNSDYKLANPENVKFVFDAADSYLSRVLPDLLKESGRVLHDEDGEEDNLYDTLDLDNIAENVSLIDHNFEDVA